MFNSFGDHPNALLLHKYGFCERDDGKGQVRLDRAGTRRGDHRRGGVRGGVRSARGRGRVRGRGRRVDEREKKKEKGRREEKATKATSGKKESETPGVAPSAVLSLGARSPASVTAAADGDGWTGRWPRSFELYDDDDDDDETLETLESDARRRPTFPYASRDLLLVLATALADPDDAERCDPSTGLPRTSRRWTTRGCWRRTGWPQRCWPSSRRGGGGRRRGGRRGRGRLGGAGNGGGGGARGGSRSRSVRRRRARGGGGAEGAGEEGVPPRVRRHRRVAAESTRGRGRRRRREEGEGRERSEGVRSSEGREGEDVGAHAGHAVRKRHLPPARLEMTAPR